MHGKHVLVTGGFGNLGSYLVKNFIEQGFTVSVLTRKQKESFDNFELNVIECDITDPKSLKSKLNFNFDYCIHCASFNESFEKNYSKESLEINTVGTKNLLEALNLTNLKNFVYISTFHVYGLTEGDIHENTELNPKNDYALTHLFAEFYIKQFGFINSLNYTILRLTNSYGVPIFKNTNKWYLALNDFVRMSYEKKEITLNSNGSSKRDMISMQDVAIIVSKILNIKSTNQIYNLSANKSYSMKELASKVKKIYRLRYKNHVKINLNKNDLNKPKSLSVKNHKLKSLIKFEINDALDEEINKIFKFLENNY